tara:strand:+ start:1738 stop:2670 length:933 start_codon:yes stop_codon:yes gene_type:complete
LKNLTCAVITGQILQILLTRKMKHQKKGLNQMSDENPNPENVDSGQPNAEPEGITATEPASDNGQVTDNTGSGTPETEPAQPATDATGESFYDPAKVPAELQKTYKDMQRAFSNKTQSIAGDKQKIEEYNAFMSNPQETLKRLAYQYGFNVVPNGGEVPNQSTPETNNEPQTWDDVYKVAESRIMNKVNERLKPLLSNIQKTTAQNIEKELNDIDPQWKLYQDEMQDNIRRHPSLVNDVSKLYQVSVPAEVLTSRATKNALQKVEDKSKAARMSGTRGHFKTEPAKEKINSFQDAVNNARSIGRKEGWYK